MEAFEAAMPLPKQEERAANDHDVWGAKMPLLVSGISLKDRFESIPHM